jgi:hypothetical protein
MTDKGLRQYRREILNETDARNLRHMRRFWQTEARRMQGVKYRGQCLALAALATTRLAELHEYHREGTA